MRQLKQLPGNGLLTGGVTLPELGLIDEYEFVVHPRLAGHGPTLLAGLARPVELRLVGQLVLDSGEMVVRYEVKR